MRSGVNRIYLKSTFTWKRQELIFRACLGTISAIVECFNWETLVEVRSPIVVDPTFAFNSLLRSRRHFGQFHRQIVAQ